MDLTASRLSAVMRFPETFPAQSKAALRFLSAVVQKEQLGDATSSSDHFPRKRHSGPGTLFTQFYVNGPVCSPSRCAFLTSQFPARLAIHGHFDTADTNKARGMPNWLDPKVSTLPRLLKDAGYVTAH